MFTHALRDAALVMLVLGSLTSLPAQDVATPTVDARLGPCRVDFTVTDRNHQPLYGVVIHAKFKHGLWGLRSMDLTVSTNSSGRARVIGLPAKLRRPPLYFTITYQKTETTWYWTSLDCYEQPTIVLDAK